MQLDKSYNNYAINFTVFTLFFLSRCSMRFEGLCFLAIAGAGKSCSQRTEQPQKAASLPEAARKI
jgi:hypothetical protein